MSGGAQGQTGQRPSSAPAQTPSFDQWSRGMNFGRGEAADDARMGAQVQYDQLIGGDRPYGTNIQGITPGQNAGNVNIGGQEWHRSGLSPSQFTEGRFDLSGMDPNAYQYSPEYGHLIRGDVASGLNKRAGEISQEDKANNPWYQKMLDSGAGVGLFTAGFLGPAFAAGGMGTGGLGAVPEAVGATGGAAGGAVGGSGGLANPSIFGDWYTALNPSGGLGGAMSGAASGAGELANPSIYGDWYSQLNPAGGGGGMSGLPTMPDWSGEAKLGVPPGTGKDILTSGFGNSSLLSQLFGGANGLLSGANAARNLGLLGGGALGGLSSLFDDSDGTQTSTNQTTNTPSMSPQASGFVNNYLTGTNPYLNQSTPTGANPYIGQSTDVGGNQFIGKTTPVGNNPNIGRTTQVGSNEFMGQTTNVGANPYAGPNPYFEDVLKRSLDDVSGRINSQFSGNAWGTSGHQEQLSRALADSGTAARMQDYGMQQQLAEADINRRAQYGFGDLSRNASLSDADVNRRATFGAGDIARDSALSGEDLNRNAMYASSDLNRNTTAAESDLNRRALYGAGDIARNASLSSDDMNRNALYGAGDLNRNAALYSSDIQNRLRAAALGMGSTTNSTTTGQNPYQPSAFGNIIGGGMLGGALLPWLFGSK
jgi:hypothetical protein